MSVHSELRDTTFAGEVILPGDDSYEQARRVWNFDIDRRPAVIAMCESTADVSVAVKYANSQGLEIAVRSGGHNMPGLSVCDDGIVIDLSRLRGANFDRETGIFKAEAGLLLRDLDRETQEVGRVVPAGQVTNTGIAGLTLGGGFGYLSRKHGLTCDNLIAVELVTVDGEVLHVDDESDPELMWGLRGGGGNFGIVTEFTYKSHPLTSVYSGWLVFPQDQANTVMQTYRDVANDAPRELCTIIQFQVPAMKLPEHLLGDGQAYLGVFIAWSGDSAEGERVLRPLRALQPIVDSVETKTYRELQAEGDAFTTFSLRWYMKAGYLNDVPDELVSLSIKHLASAPSPFCLISTFSLGGAITDVGEDDTAFSSRDAQYSFEILAAWSDASEREEHVKWAKDWAKQIEKFTLDGVYVNMVSIDDGPERVRSLYGAAKYDRLSQLKARMDPGNLLHFNQNVKPAV
ncbi:FAD-binding oxidoreductase [Nocardia sp. NBC_00565]|uniref:FAD-binding oxidoreductase n=1 Tax=Nocardia sp. NBC_00565 TaxID=2975993 RepID=UPI002E821588|nr:FAD-binding oxidoreductase [Nocardia sp. NBC_00565]WUC06595.1 FAD-binding oxidoreductase [Nocardia sp. NBC_00565]